VELVPGPDGWIDHEDVCNVLGIQGAWHVYGDGYDSVETHARCVAVGLHDPSDCAEVTLPPPPPAWGFPNVSGVFHTEGASDALLPCPQGLTTTGCPAKDFVNMTGAGVALDFNADAPPPNGDGARQAWDPAAYGVLGVSFFIDEPPAGLRIEFPMLLSDAEAAADAPPITSATPTTDEHSAGAPYWGADARGDSRFPSSPVVAGENVVTWEQVSSPRSSAYDFDLHRIIGVRFHVPAGVAVPYAFTIEHFRFVRHL
jgi:hypothetical protein